MAFIERASAGTSERSSPSGSSTEARSSEALESLTPRVQSLRHRLTQPRGQDPPEPAIRVGQQRQLSALCIARGGAGTMEVAVKPSVSLGLAVIGDAAEGGCQDDVVDEHDCRRYQANQARAGTGQALLFFARTSIPAAPCAPPPGAVRPGRPDRERLEKPQRHLAARALLGVFVRLVLSHRLHPDAGAIAAGLEPDGERHARRGRPLRRHLRLVADARGDQDVALLKGAGGGQRHLGLSLHLELQRCAADILEVGARRNLRVALDVDVHRDATPLREVRGEVDSKAIDVFADGATRFPLSNSSRCVVEWLPASSAE